MIWIAFVPRPDRPPIHAVPNVVVAVDAEADQGASHDPLPLHPNANVEAIQRDGLRHRCRGRMIAPPFSAPATSPPST